MQLLQQHELFDHLVFCFFLCWYIHNPYVLDLKRMASWPGPKQGTKNEPGHTQSWINCIMLVSPPLTSLNLLSSRRSSPLGLLSWLCAHSRPVVALCSDQISKRNKIKFDLERSHSVITSHEALTPKPGFRPGYSVQTGSGKACWSINSICLLRMEYFFTVLK